MNKSLIFNRIKLAFSLKNDAELARFLGIKRNTLSNWYTRNTIDFDKVFLKCETLSFDWLLTGKGPIKKIDKKENTTEGNNVGYSRDENTTLNNQEYSDIQTYVALLENRLKDKEKINMMLEEKIIDLEKKLEFTQLKDKESLSAKIEIQQVRLQEGKDIISAKDEIISAQTKIITQLSEAINNIKNIYQSATHKLSQSPQKG